MGQGARVIGAWPDRAPGASDGAPAIAVVVAHAWRTLGGVEHFRDQADLWVPEGAGGEGLLVAAADVAVWGRRLLRAQGGACATAACAPVWDPGGWLARLPARLAGRAPQARRTDLDAWVFEVRAWAFPTP
jgi:hypothetical protein